MGQTYTFLKKIEKILILTRPASNIKNLAIILFIYYLSGQTSSATDIINAFVPLSLVCSAFYSYNSWQDNGIDNHTTNKNHYSNAFNGFSKKTVIILIYVLLISGLIWGLLINFKFFIILLCLWLSVFIYSNPKTRYKEKKWLDIIFGAILTNLLRFLGAWIVLAPTIPIPTLGILIVVFYKVSGYLLYKELDRENLKNLGFKNSTTHCTQKTIMNISISLMILTILGISILFLNNFYKTPFSGILPIKLLYYFLLLIPPGIFFLLKTIGIIKMKTLTQKFLRISGILYIFIVLIITYLFT